MDGDNIDARCVVHWLFSIKPLRIGCRPRFGRALTGQTANQIGSKGFLLAKFFYDYQIGLLPSIVSQNHRQEMAMCTMTTRPQRTHLEEAPKDKASNDESQLWLGACYDWSKPP
jgi:hypothetical protein